MAVTIYDVAKLAGVNVSTVSRVINGKAHVLQETKTKIYAAMEELDYHPNSVARSLASGLSGAIGVVVDAEDAEAFSNVFFNRSLFAIEHVAQQRKYNVILLNGAKKAGGVSAVEKLILEKKVDGLILPPSTIKPSLMEKIENFPCVTLGQPDSVNHLLSWVDVNNAQGAETAVRHLYAQGYVRIAYFGGDGRTGFSKRRMKGYENALNRGYPSIFIPTDGTTEDAQATAEKCLALKDHPDAFVCNDNLAAFGLLKAAKKLNRQVPEEIGIVTFDNYPLAEYTDPPLSCIDVDTALLGEQVAKLLFENIDQNLPSQQILLGTSLIERKSSVRK